MSTLYEIAIRETTQCLNDGHIAAARAKLKDAAAIQPLDNEGVIVWAEILRRQRRNYPAGRLLERILRTNPADPLAIKFYLAVLWGTDNLHRVTLAMVKFLDAGGSFSAIENAFDTLIANDPPVRHLSVNFKVGRLYLTAGYLETARKFFVAAPEVENSKFEISLIDSLLENTVPDINLYQTLVHPRPTLQIAVNRMASVGKREEVLSFLNRVFIPFKAVSKNNLQIQRPFFCSMPKSGTGFTLKIFEAFSGMKTSKVDYKVLADDVVIPAAFDSALKWGHIPWGHCAATDDTLKQIANRELPIYLQIRDPRDATWSYFRMLEKWPVLVRMGYSFLPPNYSNASYDERIRILYELYYPSLMAWLASWKSAIESQRFPILISRYEDFSADNVGRIVDLFAFCGASVPRDIVQQTVSRLREALEGPGKHSFREGGPGSWRSNTSSEILALVDKYWDNEVLSYFGYNK